MSLYFLYTLGNLVVISSVLLCYWKLVFTAQVCTIHSIQYQQLSSTVTQQVTQKDTAYWRYLKANFRGKRGGGGIYIDYSYRV